MRRIVQSIASSCLFAISLMGISVGVTAEESKLAIKVWHANAIRPQTMDFVLLALEKSGLSNQDLHVIEAKFNGHNQAFDALIEGENLDVLVSAVNAPLETQTLPIYIPLDRGLLGFRVCFIHQDHQNEFASLGDKQDLVDKQLKIGLGVGWPDTKIMQANHVSVSAFTSTDLIFDALLDDQIDCYSRSVAEIGQENVLSPEVIIESSVGFIYPLADIIYVSNSAPELHAKLNYGLQLAMEDGSFEALIDKHYGQSLIDMNFYFRHLIIMQNPFISEPAFKALNQYGLASFNRVTNIR